MRLLTQAAQDVLAERRRQIDGEGWTPEHDDEHNHSDLARAAACYALMAAGWRADGETISQHWPWMSRPKPSQGPRRNLVKAGALILAEIERLDRAIRAKPEPCTKCGNVPPACSGPNEPHISTSCADCGAVFYTSAARAMHTCLNPKVAARYIEELRQMNANKNVRIEELEAERDALQDRLKTEPWSCGRCGQRNSGWCPTCGRCEAMRPIPTETPFGEMRCSKGHRLIQFDGSGGAGCPLCRAMAEMNELGRINLDGAAHLNAKDAEIANLRAKLDEWERGSCAREAAEAERERIIKLLTGSNPERVLCYWGLGAAYVKFEFVEDNLRVVLEARS